MKKLVLAGILLFLSINNIFSQEMQDDHAMHEQIIANPEMVPDIKHNPWSLIIYRPENTEKMNDVWCWVKFTDAETGEDVTYSRLTAQYEWVSQTVKIQPKDHHSIESIFSPTRLYTMHNYQKTFYLAGGMAMHINLKPGKYFITVYTPKEKAGFFKCSNKGDWLSNKFYYDTENPAKVIFVVPTANENGFYDGGWFIDWKAPEFFVFTKPKM